MGTPILWLRSASPWRKVREQTDAPSITLSGPISWDSSKERGRRVIAQRELHPHTVIEIAPAIPILEMVSDTHLAQYVFTLDRMGQQSGSRREGASHALVFGLMSLCNHSDDPNADVRFETHSRRGLEAVLVSQRRIPQGAEVTIRYPDVGWYKDKGLL